ncbi:MAG TPA: hypothetical protein VFC26_04340, partial [Verrucomicrobiae bacterium]|nr:hypothetical protein [Verrucomicrobiae bacterium]
MLLFRITLPALILLLPAIVRAAPNAEVLSDLLELFPKATVTNSSSTELRRPASAGGMKQDALFEHPAHGKPARVEFKVALPRPGSGELLLLSFETALADGITLSPGVDGVRFAVEIDGKRIFEHSCRETRWTPHMIDLAEFAGRTVNLSLITDEIGNSSYDWAVWGTPRVLKLFGTTKPENARDLVFAPKFQLLKLGPSRAVVAAGETVTVRAEVKNVGYGASRSEQVQLRGVSSRAVPELSPDASWVAEWELPNAESMELEAVVGTNALKSRLEVSRPVTTNTIANQLMRIDFIRESDGYAFARIFGKQNKNWKELGIWKPLFQINDSVRPLVPRSHTKSSIEFVQPALDLHGAEWQVTLRVTLDRERRPLARIHYKWESGKRGESQALWGPNIYVGNSAAKSWGLFPGLEYLYGPERSSNPRDFAPPLHDRRTPPPHQITIPLMAVTPASYGVPASAGSRFFTPDSLMDHAKPYDENPQHTVSLHWSPGNISARFASPNFDEHMDNHRLALFTTNATSLDATLVVAEGPVLAAVREWLRDNGGLPKPNPWPRSFHEELDLCRIGFLKTVSDEKGEKFRHCIGWGASHSPGFAALLWLDSRIATNRDSAARVDAVATKMGSWVSQANCHIMQWEFPFLYGRLAESLAELDGLIAGLIKSQRPDGGWVYEPANKEQADLGRAGDSVLGTCANRAS